MALSYNRFADYLIQKQNTAAKPAGLQIEKIAANRVRVQFVDRGQVLRFRILMYSIGSTSRGRPDERRVEITSTYNGGLRELAGHVDIVVGVERETGNIVALDARRLNEGGNTHNASTFVYSPSFQNLKLSPFFILQNSRQHLFDSEYQIYMRPEYLLDYLRQQTIMHGSGLPEIAATATNDAMTDILDEAATGGSSQVLSFDQQVQLQLKKMMIGQIGERFVFALEKKRLESEGKLELANKVKWVSQTQPYLGYDIRSFAKDAAPQMVEVKSSVGLVKKFFFSAHEKRIAAKFEKSYKLVCVSHVMEKPSIRVFLDPIAQIESGRLEITSDTSLVSIV